MLQLPPMSVDRRRLHSVINIIITVSDTVDHELLLVIISSTLPLTLDAAA